MRIGEPFTGGHGEVGMNGSISMKSAERFYSMALSCAHTCMVSSPFLGNINMIQSVMSVYSNNPAEARQMNNRQKNNGTGARVVEGYTLTAVTLHWATAVIVISAAVLGIYMHELPFSPAKLKLYSYHKWMGVTVFLLALIRLGWRSSHPVPALPAAMPLWEKKVSKGAHAALYALMLAVPLAGWVMSSAHGFQTVYLGIIPIPDLIGKDKELAGLLEKVHAAFSLSFMALVILHAAAALKHHFINRDNVLKRMMGSGRLF